LSCQSCSNKQNLGLFIDCIYVGIWVCEAESSCRTEDGLSPNVSQLIIDSIWLHINTWHIS
jgi:hypothetical protein